MEKYKYKLEFRQINGDPILELFPDGRYQLMHFRATIDEISEHPGKWLPETTLPGVFEGQEVYRLIKFKEELLVKLKQR